MSLPIDQIDQIPTSNYYGSLDLSSSWESTELDRTTSLDKDVRVPLSKIFDLGIKSHILEWWNRNRVRDHGVTDFFLEGLDDSSELLLTERQKENLPDVEIPKIAGKLARLARMTLSIEDSNQTTAMQIVVREYLIREMKQMSMRNNVIAAVLPFAVKLSFVPTRHELQARAMTVQDEYVQRFQLNKPLFTRRRPWLFNWLGTKHTEPVLQRV
jgi:hypothetical protein